ncbi:hypothetical protein Tco_0845634 [Tanacetum coccineum]
MLDSEHSTLSYTSISSDSDPSAWGIPLMDADEVPEIDPYEEVAQQGQAAPPSPVYAPDPIELEDHVPVYVTEPEEDPEGDSEEDPVDYAADAYDDEDEKEESSEDDDDEEEENLAPADSTAATSLVVEPVLSTKETQPFETNESAATPPPAYQIDRLLAIPTPPPSPLTPLSSPFPLIPSPPYPVGQLASFSSANSADTTDSSFSQCPDLLTVVGQESSLAALS